MMLVAGAATCIITWIMDYSIPGKLFALLISLVVFYILGVILRNTLDRFEKQNEAKSKEEGEVIEKEAHEELEQKESET